MKINLRYAISAFNYIGVGFISGSISHGFFSGTRSIIMALLGLTLFVLGEFLEKKYIEKEEISDSDNYIRIILTGLLFSIGIGMISGGIQHFLDSPTRSLWIIPLGFIISYLIYPKREEIKDIKWFNLFRTAIVFGIVLFSITFTLVKIIPESMVGGDDHHEESTSVGEHHE